MKEGPEALVGGPPLSLSEGPALSAFRLRPPGQGCHPCYFGECALTARPGPLALDSPHLPSKGLFLQQPSLLWCFLNGAATVMGWG